MTPHLEAKHEDYADVVLMPGDPVRATYIADTFLTEVKQVNSIRNCFGYTGLFKNKRVSVQASGMGQASLGIYAFELFNFYNVQKIIRVGTCGVFSENINLGDVVIAMTAGTENSITNQTFKHYTFSPCCDYELLTSAVNKLQENKLTCHVGSISSSDYFYQDQSDWWITLRDNGIIGVDMETHMLYALAMKYMKKALTVNLVSDNIATHMKLSPSDRVTKVDSIVKSVLESVI